MSLICLPLASMPTFMQNDNRIVGGLEAPYMIPWQVSVSHDKLVRYGICGGTILDECTILSAAHCGFENGGFIRAGSTKKTYGGQVIQKWGYFQCIQM